MIDYDFLDLRVEQLENDHNWMQASYMVDALLNNNMREFKRVNPENEIIDNICLDLWQSLDQTYNPDIPF